MVFSRWCVLLLRLAGICLLAGATPAGAGIARLVAIDGPIGPATTDHLRRGLQEAETEGAAVLVLRLDTPGGLDAATRDIVRAILASRVPVVAWVAPSGARAASAGTYILYASHVAAMAPGTNLGAATPVPLGGPSAPTSPKPKPEAEDTEPADKPAPATAMERKVVNDAAAYLRSLAELRGRNAEWAEQAVREGASLAAHEALREGIVELQAADLDSLLNQLDGRVVRMPFGEVTLATANSEVRELEGGLRYRLLTLITNPTVAYLLLLAGLYGLLLEGYNPGGLVPGITGLLCLLLAAYALQVLPVNYAGVALIVLGVLLMLAEVLTPSFGVLGVGGIAALVLGSLILFDTDLPGFHVSVGLIAAIAFVSSAAMLGLMLFLAQSRRRPQQSGREVMIGASGTALEDFAERGRVRVGGEIWRAVASQPVRAGQGVQVEAIHGLTLHVRPTDNAR